MNRKPFHGASTYIITFVNLPDKFNNEHKHSAPTSAQQCCYSKFDEDKGFGIGCRDLSGRRYISFRNNRDPVTWKMELG